jgi:hypothetical protein
MVDPSFDSLGLGASTLQVLPDLVCQVRSVFMRPVIIIHKRMRIVEIVHKVVLDVRVGFHIHYIAWMAG